MRSFPYTYMCECEATVDLTVTPDRPPPPCSNPDSPAFSDSGDDGDVDGPDTCPRCEAKIDFDKVYEEAMEYICDRDEAEYEDAMEMRAESRRERDAAEFGDEPDWGERE